MSRVADADFKDLEQFLVEYRMSSDLGAQVRGLLLRRFHRQVLAALQIFDRLSALASSGEAIIHAVPLSHTADNFSYLGEYFSDVVCSLGCAIHGLYKPANMQLRSAIETAVRGLAGATSLEATETRSVYRLFELAALQKPFLDESVADLAALQQLYGDLCLFVHSATPAQRTGLHHIAAHMKQDSARLKELVVSFERINRSVLSVLIRADKRLYTRSSPRVQDLLDEVIPKDVRLKALGA